MKLKRNRVKCLDCGVTLESKHRHDYKTCDCPNKTMVDGGLEYVRYGGMDMGKIELIHEYCEDDTFLWGVFNHETGFTEKRALDDIENNHLLNIALHLRTRHERLPPDLGKAQHGRDLEILYDHILPEIKERGLTEVREEIPY